MIHQPNMEPLANRHVLVGVTGSIAAYKAAELVRRLREVGADVRVVMTSTATEFIGPLTLQALSGFPVRTGRLDAQGEAGMDHISLARWADVVLIAPASADILAKLAHGLADELLTTLCLATAAPLVLAPAMNRQMWENAATRGNCCLLRERGIRICGPAEGAQACGESGYGRMAEPHDLVQGLTRYFTPPLLQDLRVLVSAGPTREDIDAVRFISNRSSGKMGFGMAQAAAEAGASVTLVTGPVSLSTPSAVRRLDVQTAEQMLDAVMLQLPNTDIFVSVAAVADYRPVRRIAQKLKKGASNITLDLVPTADILTHVASSRDAPFMVGFAAETEHLEGGALAKLAGKGLDMIAANRVGGPGSGFESDENVLLLLWQGGRMELARAPKLHLARRMIAVIAERYHAKARSGQDPRSQAG
jgi:phosphopantothenoylcysteine decarboxylase / phosphopantothenate---cysteine ligase